MGMAQVVEHLLTMPKGLSSIPSTGEKTHLTYSIYVK
jgi:hypothetical protein